MTLSVKSLRAPCVAPKRSGGRLLGKVRIGVSDELEVVGVVGVERIIGNFMSVPKQQIELLC